MVQTRRQHKNLKKGSRQQRGGRNKKKTIRQTRRRNDNNKGQKHRQNKGARMGGAFRSQYVRDAHSLAGQAAIQEAALKQEIANCNDNFFCRTSHNHGYF